MCIDIIVIVVVMLDPGGEEGACMLQDKSRKIGLMRLDCLRCDALDE